MDAKTRGKKAAKEEWGERRNWETKIDRKPIATFPTNQRIID